MTCELMNPLNGTNFSFCENIYDTISLWWRQQKNETFSYCYQINKLQTLSRERCQEVDVVDVHKLTKSAIKLEIDR